MRLNDTFIINTTVVISTLLTVGLVGYYATTPRSSSSNLLRMLPKPNKSYSMCSYNYTDTHNRVTYVTCVCDGGSIRVIPSTDCICFMPTPHNVGIRCFCDDVYEERILNETENNNSTK